MAITIPFSFHRELCVWMVQEQGQWICCGLNTPSFPARCAVSAHPAGRALMLGKGSLHVCPEQGAAGPRGLSPLIVPRD